MNTLKKYIPHLIILALFIVASVIYFWPAMQGQVIFAGDQINGIAATHQGNQYYQQTGESSFWAQSMFSGMPNYQTGGNGGYMLDHILKPVHLFFRLGLNNVAFLFLFYLIAFFLLLRSFRINPWICLAGAFAIALSSYFFVIIAAQHHGKCYSITWMTITIVGFILTFRRQEDDSQPPFINQAWGALLVAFFTYIGFFLHPQMSYYLCMLIGLLYCAELSIAIRDKSWRTFTIGSLLFFASFGIGMGMGSANVFVNQEYAEQTMRGGHSDLTQPDDATNKTKGLDLDYATAWSEGIDETLTFLVPNYMGGASGYNLGDDSNLEKQLRQLGVDSRQARTFAHSAPTYWGEKAFTSGPVYMGAVIIFLFFLGLILLRGPYMWALLIATCFSIALSWGHNFMPLTRLFFNYFPAYNKFRAVESILIVAQITVPLIGFLTLKVIHDASITWKRLRTAIIVAGAFTAGICLTIALAGSFIDVTSSYDTWKSQVGDRIYRLILDERRAMMRADAWRSLLFVILGAALTFWYAWQRSRQHSEKHTIIFSLLLTALILADMWTVDKRFCNDNNFVEKKELYRNFDMLPYEKKILDNDTTHFRVLNLSTNTFNEARTSYYLNSIGGYSAAKLRRYQDMIDRHIAPQFTPYYQTLQQTYGFRLPDTTMGRSFQCLNMLNMKYAIVPMQNGQADALLNPYAFGPAWLVDSLVYVAGPNQECDTLMNYDLRHTAVIDTTFDLNKTGLQALPSSLATGAIRLTHADQKQVCYHTQTQAPALAILSEIYYPYGWKLYIDGQKAETLLRANYILRAVPLPAGNHDITLAFEPDSVRKGNLLAITCFAIFIVALIAASIYFLISRHKKQPLT